MFRKYSMTFYCIKYSIVNMTHLSGTLLLVSLNLWFSEVDDSLGAY